MISNEPYEIAEVRRGSSVSDEGEHRGVFDAIYVQRQRANRYADHAFGVIEKLYGLRVQWEIVGVLKQKVSFFEVTGLPASLVTTNKAEIRRLIWKIKYICHSDECTLFTSL